jgi:hypothetical protein
MMDNGRGRNCSQLDRRSVMNLQEVVNSIDEFIFEKTGQHLDSLQFSILRGVLDGKKYMEIAKEYGCSTSHAKDKGYKLWQLLSGVFEEDVNKSNLTATVKRLGFFNYQSPFIGNNLRIETINLCGNSEPNQLPYKDNFHFESNGQNPVSEETKFKQLLQRTKFQAVEKLSQLGLTPEQISESLDLPLPEVENWLD